MAQPLQQILTTKIFVARPRNELVAREELDRKLDSIPARRLTLISAPAGFGKTTLVGNWIGSRGFPTAWISLDAGDNELPRFLSYLVASLRTIHPGVGEGLLEALALSPLPPVETLLASLVNDLASALTVKRDLTAFVCYDKQLSDAAGAAGLPVESPA